MKYTILILLSTTEKWLRLTRPQRGEFVSTALEPIIGRYSDSLKLKMFDSESMNARHTDFIIIETNDLNKYYHFWEEIRDSKIYTEPYFIVNEIIVGQEEAFKEFEEAAGLR